MPEPTDLPQRLRLLRVTPEFLAGLLATGRHPGYEVIEHGLPEDVEVLRAQYVGAANHCFELLLRHASFEPVPPGEPVPEITPVCRVIYLLTEVAISCPSPA